MSWIGDAFSSKWNQIWDDGYQFGDIFRTSLMPVSAPVSKVVNDVGTSVSNYLGSEDGQNMVDELKNGITNAWYKYTGQSHLTDEVKHAEMREDTINQRTAADMIAAGLSKFGINPASAGASSHASGITMLDSIAKAQQIKAQALAFKEQKYNYDVSKKLGIRTGDKNMFAPIIALAKGLFGVDVDDIPEEGILPALSNWLKGLFGGSGDGSTTGAMGDAAAAAVSDSSKASWMSDPYVFAPMKLDTDLKIRKRDVKSVDVAGESNDSSKKALDVVGVKTDTSSVTPESNPSSYGVFSNDFKKDARSFVQTMVNDKMLSTDNLDLLAHQLSKRYNLSVEQVRKYLTDLARELR